MPMRAVIVREFGPIENARVEEVSPSSPGPDEVLIHGAAAEVNFPDILVMEGAYQVKPPLPFSPGKEVAGTVAKVGAAVQDLKPGDRIAAQVEFGAYSEAVIAPANSCYRIPDSMPFADAAAIGLSYQTAHFALLERAGFQEGDSVLVTGAAGGVGLAAIQLVKALNGTALAGVINEQQAEIARANGADHIIDLTADPLRDQLRQQVFDVTNNHGADIVIDPVGGSILEASLRALAWCGRLVVIGFAAGEIPAIRSNYLLVKNIAVMGLQWSDYRDRTPGLVRAAQDHLYELYRSGDLKPHIDRVAPLEDFASVLEDVRAGKVKGKAILAITGDR